MKWYTLVFLLLAIHCNPISEPTDSSLGDTIDKNEVLKRNFGTSEVRLYVTRNPGTIRHDILCDILPTLDSVVQPRECHETQKIESWSNFAQVTQDLADIAKSKIANSAKFKAFAEKWQVEYVAYYKENGPRKKFYSIFACPGKCTHLKKVPKIGDKCCFI